MPEATDLEVSDLKGPPNGESNETLLFDAVWNEGSSSRREALVLRIEPKSVPLFMGGDLRLQWDMMRAVAASSPVPVPRLWWYEADEAPLGAPFFLMSQVDGQVPNGYDSELIQELDPQQRQTMYRNGLEALAQIHAIDRTEFGFLEKQSRGQPGLDGYLGYVEDWHRWVAKGRSLPAMEAGLRWLRAHQPAEVPTTLIWGDSRPGNMMINPVDQSVAAILDWEVAAIATAEVDLAWWMLFETVFSNMGIPVPDGVPDRNETLAMYESYSGRSLRDMAYFDALAWSRFAIVCVGLNDKAAGSDREAVMQSTYDLTIDRLSQAIDYVS